VSAAHLRALCAHYRAHDERVVSAYGDTRGIPAVWPGRDFPALAALVGDRGAKGLLTGHEHAIALAGGALDLDTPDDVARWRASAPASPPAGTRPNPRD
jgi:molybdenum cofactor cytidylyltransferase